MLKRNQPALQESSKLVGVYPGTDKNGNKSDAEGNHVVMKKAHMPELICV